MRAKIFTAEVIAALPGWIQAGLDAETIAARIGSTRASVQTMASTLGLRWNGRPPSAKRAARFAERQAQAQARTSAGAIEQATIAVPITTLARDKLAQRASLRGMGPGAFAGLLIETIANDGLYDAVLDGA